MYCAEPGFLNNTVGPMVLTAISVMVLVLSIAYFAAQFFRRPEYETFVSIETHQLLVSLLLFLTIFGSTCLAAELSVSYAGGDPFEIGRSYLSYIQGTALDTVVTLQGSVLVTQYWGSWSQRFGAGAWGTSSLLFAGVILLERVMEFILLLATPFAASLMVQQMILEVIKGTVLPFLLPAAIVLRIFRPTRDASAFLLATALGFGIVYPYTYVIHSSVVRPMMDRMYSSGTTDIGAELRAKHLDNLADDLTSFFDPSAIIQPLNSLSFLLLQSLFLPALSITLTISFIKGFSKFISQKFD